MKYLITLPWMPYPATDGGKQGAFNMLMELQNMIDITLIYPVFFKKQMACQYLLEKQLPKVKVYPFEYYKNKDGIKSQYSLFRLHRIITRKFLKQPYLATPIYKDAYIDFVNEIIKKSGLILFKMNILNSYIWFMLFLIL